MIAGTPEAARWFRSEPRRTLPVSLLERMARTAFPCCRVVDTQPLAEGLRNTNLKVQLDCLSLPIVFRVYEHDQSLCQKEVDLIRLVARLVPVQAVIHMEPCGLDEIPPFALFHYVEGISFYELKAGGDRDAIAQAAYSIGQALAAIGRMSFQKPGWLGPGPDVTTPLLEGADPTPRFVDLCLASANLQRRMPAELRHRTQALVWSWAPHLSRLEDRARLVHGDFGKRNLVVRSVAGRWLVAAVLDWEFAVSGSPLADLGTFLRYERASCPLAEPHFSDGYLQAGGTLPRDWRQLARLLDLAALCESLTHDQLPDPVAVELVELVRATIENRDPQLP